MIIERMASRATNVLQEMVYFFYKTLTVKHIPIWALAAHYKLDKLSSSGYHDYISIYSNLFSKVRNDVKSVLEIGIGVVEDGQMLHVKKKGYETGNSLRFWRDYFPQAEIMGADIFEVEIKEERITTFICDQRRKDSIMNLATMIGGKVDIIIDDGSHVYEDQLNTFIWLYDKVNIGGIYVIEDIRKDNVTRFASFENIPMEMQDEIRKLFDLEIRSGTSHAADCIVIYKRK